MRQDSPIGKVCSESRQFWGQIPFLLFTCWGHWSPSASFLPSLSSFQIYLGITQKCKVQRNTNAKWLLISIHPSIFLSTLVLIYSSSLSVCLCLSACLSIYHPLCACVCVCVCVCITTTTMGIKHPITFVHADSQSICPPRDNHHCLPQINFACPWNSHKWNQQNVLFHVSGFFHSA